MGRFWAGCVLWFLPTIIIDFASYIRSRLAVLQDFVQPAGDTSRQCQGSVL
jgi:hypothetical protein